MDFQPLLIQSKAASISSSIYILIIVYFIYFMQHFYGIFKELFYVKFCIVYIGHPHIFFVYIFLSSYIFITLNIVCVFIVISFISD